jgi:hypothetical protein
MQSAFLKIFFIDAASHLNQIKWFETGLVARATLCEIPEI